MRYARLLFLVFLVGCAMLNPSDESQSLGAGFRYSPYGPPYNPGNDYWAAVGEQMAARFPGSHAEAIWIVGILNGDGTYLSFQAETDDPYITSGYVDMNEAALTLFDEQGVKVWLQVEAGMADVEELIRLVMGQYAHHPCILGFGVDVEWYQSTGDPIGMPVSDEVAQRWVEAVQAFGSQFRLFLKHWEIAWMPPNVREGIVFVDDGQQYESLEEIVAEFSAWGKAFSPAEVAFQYGYASDRIWWRELQDPPGDIGEELLEAVPNTSALYWVDFTVFEIFPPE